MISFNLIEHKLELKTTWSISRESSDFKINFIVEASDGEHFGLGECAISPRYNQTHEKIRSEFQLFLDAKLFFRKIEDLKNIQKLEISAPLAFAIESSIVHLWSEKKNISVSKFLGLKDKNEIKTSYSIPIMKENLIKDYLKTNSFNSYKLKIGKENGKELLNEVIGNTASTIRIDANEAFDNISELLNIVDGIDPARIEFIEQPFKSENLKAYAQLYQQNIFPIMADEAFINEKDFPIVRDHFHMVNLKLMKVGSYYRAIELATELKKMGKDLMIGCMIETSVGITSAMNIASLFDIYDLDGSLLLKSDPYDLLKVQQDKLFFNYS